MSLPGSGWGDDPYPRFARLRESQPVLRGPSGEWMLLRYDDVRSALTDNRRFRNSLVGTELFEHRLRQLSPGSDAAGFGELPLLQMDPPDHTRLRRLVGTAFSPRVVERLRARVHQIVAGLLAEAATKGSVDVIGDFAYPLPVIVICDLLGVPAPDRDAVRRWSSALGATPGGFELFDDPAVAKPFREAFMGLGELMSRLLDRRRGEFASGKLGADLLSHLVAVEDGGDRLTAREAVSTAVMLLVAGHETTANLIGNATLALLRHTDQRHRLLNHPALIDSAVEELLRFDGPLQAVTRAANEHVELRGNTIRRGDVVLLQLGAANRDPQQFPDPDRLDLTRPNNRHVAFGQGIHFCLGASLARLQARIALPALLTRFPNIRVGTPTVRWRPNPFLRGLEALPVTLN